MLFYLIIILFGSFWNFCSCYDIPNVKLELLSQGFTLGIPDELGIKQVFYTIRINDECPTIMDILFQARNGWITTEVINILKPKDKLNVSILVNHLGQAYNSYQYLVVGENNMGTKVSNSNSRPAILCGTIDAKCKESQTTVMGMTNLCEGQLLFEEDFNQIELDTNKWSYDIRHRLIGTDNEEFVLFDNNRENIFIQDGYLNIKPTFTRENMRNSQLDFGSRCTPVFKRNKECVLMTQPPFRFIPPVNSSQIHTAHTFQFKYGRIEVKAKLPKGDWILPYIMLKHYDAIDEKQIRIAFARGNEELTSSDNVDISGKVLFAGIVANEESYKRNFRQKSLPVHYGNDFHVYALIWKKDEIIMEVDGVMYGTITDNLENFNKMFFLSFGVSVGGHIEFPDNLLKPNFKPWSNTSPTAVRDFWNNIGNGKISWSGNDFLKIDYVKVFAV